MDINRAKEIISALAEGVDPTTGEILSDNSIYNKGEVVRALYAVLNYLDTKKSRKEAGKEITKKQPANAGKPWRKEDDSKLIDLYRNGASKKDICNTLHRSETGVAARLVRLGMVEDRDEFRNGK